MARAIIAEEHRPEAQGFETPRIASYKLVTAPEEHRPEAQGFETSPVGLTDL